MAHSVLHFSLGMLLGSAASLRGVLTRSCEARWLGRWILLSMTLGLLAVTPGLLRRAGVPDAVCDGWWMNVFVFYPLLNHLKRGGLPLGLLIAAGVFSVQYTLILRAIARQGRSYKKGQSDRNDEEDQAMEPEV